MYMACLQMLECPVKSALKLSRGGGGTPIYSYIGMCRCEG